MTMQHTPGRWRNWDKVPHGIYDDDLNLIGGVFTNHTDVRAIAALPNLLSALEGLHRAHEPGK